jgi:signal peptidase I
MRLRRKKTLLLIATLVVVGCLGALSLYRIFFTRFVRVPTGAMLNTIFIGDTMLVNKGWGKLRRGQIVLFRYPGDADFYISRIVGLPGETIYLQGALVFVNGNQLAEQRVFTKAQDIKSKAPLEELSVEGSGNYRVFYVAHDRQSEDDADSAGTFGIDQPYHLGEDEYFLLGDNRDNSYDSRYRGPVPKDLIWGATSLVFSSSSTSSDEVRWNRVMKRIN